MRVAIRDVDSKSQRLSMANYALKAKICILANMGIVELDYAYFSCASDWLFYWVTVETRDLVNTSLGYFLAIISESYATEAVKALMKLSVAGLLQNVALPTDPFCFENRSQEGSLGIYSVCLIGNKKQEFLIYFF